MSLKFGTATFGERNKAHALLSASDQAFGQALVPYTDLPNETPNSVGNEPMVSGFPLADQFVFLSVVRDPDASRGGMVRANAVFIPEARVTEIENLSPILDLVSNHQTDFPTGKKVILNVDRVNLTPPLLEAIDLYRGLVDGHGSGPLVWVGQERFPDAIASLWQSVIKEARSSLSFRFACRPTDPLADQCAVVVVPPQSMGKWKEYLRVSDATNRTPLSRHESIFFQDETRDGVYSLAQKLGYRLDRLDKFAEVSKCFEILENLSTKTDQEISIGARWLASLSPNPNTASDIKGRLMAELLKRVRKGPINTLKYLRNFNPEAYADGHRIISAACGERFRELTSEDPMIGAELAQYAIDAPEFAWSAGILSAVRSMVADKIEAGELVYVDLLFGQQELVDAIWIHETARLANDLEDTVLRLAGFDAIAESQLSELQRFCATNGWDRVHARLVASNLTSPNAISAQVDFPKLTEAGVRELANALPSREFVVESAKTGVELFWNQAADLCVSDPLLLRNISIPQYGWRRIFMKFATKSTPIHDNLHELDIEVRSSYDMLLAGELDDAEFFEAITATTLGNLLAHDRRDELWGKLSGNARTQALARTAAAWLAELERNLPQGSLLEQDLRLEVLRPEHRGQLLPTSEPSYIRLCIDVFDQFPELGEYDFGSYRIRLFSDQKSIGRNDAQRIGALVCRRRWTDAADAILRDYKSYGRVDLMPALEQCCELFGLLKRIWNRLQIGKVTEDEWWNELVDLACSLYPEGPRHEQVWSMAGGSYADLTNNGTGRSQWHESLQWLRQSGGNSNVTIEKLLGKMRERYSTNPELEGLIKYCPFELRFSPGDTYID